VLRADVVVGRAHRRRRRRDRLRAHGGRVVGRLGVGLDGAAMRVSEGRERRSGQEEADGTVHRWTIR
jgi:hypothetical protein